MLSSIAKADVTSKGEIRHEGNGPFQFIGCLDAKVGCIRSIDGAPRFIKSGGESVAQASIRIEVFRCVGLFRDLERSRRLRRLLVGTEVCCANLHDCAFARRFRVFRVV